MSDHEDRLKAGEIPIQSDGPCQSPEARGHMALKAPGPIWVVCITHDYGVVRSAGYFRTKAAAEQWIASDDSQSNYAEGYYAVRLTPKETP